MTSAMYNNFVYHMGLGEVVWGTNIHVALTDTQPTKTHAHYSQLAGELTTASGYTAGGAALTCSAPAVSGSDPALYMMFDATDLVWASPSSFGPLKFAAVYSTKGGAHPTDDATMPLISYHDFAAEKTAGGDTFTVVWAAEGVFRILVSAAA